MTAKVPLDDLDHILTHTQHLWSNLRGARIFVSGGTGFFGCWLLESFAHVNEMLGLGASAVVLTRNPAAFHRKVPHLAACPSIQLLEGDIRSFVFPDGEFRFIVHAAGDASTHSATDSPLETLDTIVSGTRHMLEFASSCGVSSFLYTSSGAVYGRQPPDLTYMPETFRGGPDPSAPTSVYGESKRLAELLCSLYASRYGFQCKIARCFAFSGPHLPLNGPFAIGNFVRDAILNRPLRIDGDGTAFRSYLYAADLAIWLWTILFQGKNCVPYNVGSEHDLPVAALANAVVTAVNPRLVVEIGGMPVPGQVPGRYVPSTTLAQTELGLREYIGLDAAVIKMASWNRSTDGEKK
jgi:nucleoside-diphosphate-sugar epimerase